MKQKITLETVQAQIKRHLEEAIKNEREYLKKRNENPPIRPLKPKFN